MRLTWRFLADLGERAGWTFVESYFTAWMMIPTLAGDTPGGFDTLFTANNFKFAVVAAAASIAKSIGVKKINNPNSASVLPPEAQPPAPQPPLAEAAEQSAGVVTAAVHSERLNTWSTVYLHPEAAEDEGTFVLTGEQRDGLPVARYQPDRAGTHSPLGPLEMSAAGLRLTIPEAN